MAAKWHSLDSVGDHSPDQSRCPASAGRTASCDDPASGTRCTAASGRRASSNSQNSGGRKSDASVSGAAHPGGTTRCCTATCARDPFAPARLPSAASHGAAAHPAAAAVIVVSVPVADVLCSGRASAAGASTTSASTTTVSFCLRPSSSSATSRPSLESSAATACDAFRAASLAGAAVGTDVRASPVGIAAAGGCAAIRSEQAVSLV
jgi:hypothetical protein